MNSAREDRELWRSVAQFVDSSEKQSVLKHLAHTDPILQPQRDLLPIVHGDTFLLQEVLAELIRDGLVQRLLLRDGKVYCLMPGLRESVLRLAEYYDQHKGSAPLRSRSRS